jgi:hypothetical protein
VVAENDTISGYCIGLWAQDTAYLSSSTISGNNLGIEQNFGSTVFSRDNNTIENNGTNVIGTFITFFGQ